MARSWAGRGGRGSLSKKQRAVALAGSVVVQELESRLFFNQAPYAPVITEPLTDGKVVFGSDVHMEIGDFADPDAGQTRLNTDWEIWTTTATPQRVWYALAQVGPYDDHHIHLGDGTFDGPLAGKTRLNANTDYQLRVRTRDNSGDVLTNTSPVSVRNFHTIVEDLPTAAGWVAQQPGYKVEELPLTFPTGEQPFRLPTNIVFVPEAIHGHHPDDPLFYVMELYGSIREVSNNFTVHTYATGLLNYNPAGPISGSGENGSAGLAVDPKNGDLYATMLYDDLTDATTDTYPKIVRFQSSDGGVTGVGTDILKMPLEPMRQSHFISNITFGPDDKLYVHIGDGFNASTGQNLNYFRGKIIRLNRDGSAPTDNPFYNPVDRGADGLPDAEDYVWAYGYRNPFGGAWRDADQSHYVVENGPSRDRFSKMVRGQNYLYDGSDTSMNNFNIAYSPTGTFENGAEDWNPAVAPVNLAFIQQSTGNYSGFPVDKWDHAFVATSGPTHAAGPNFAKSIQEWALNADGTRKVPAAGDANNPRELVSYEGAGYATAAGIAAGPDGLYFTTLYPDTDTNPAGLGAKILRVVYTGTTGPIDQYTFDEASGTAAADTGAQPLAGTLTNGPVHVAGTVGAGALQLDGVNDYVALPKNIASRLGGTATFSAWIRTTQTGNAINWLAPGLTGVEQAGAGNDVFWGWLDNTGRIGVQANDFPAAKSINPINDGVWHQVTFTRDAVSGVVQVYVDGVLNSSAVSDTGYKSTPFASIGRIEDTAGNPKYFAGSLDDVRIYDRVLSASEIAALMPGGVNTAPTVATAATATAGSTTVNLSALGADNGGEANLTYTWSVIAKPAGAANPTFSSNGQNGSKSTIATLTQAGAYTFRVTIKDVPGLTVTSDVTVTINATLTGVTINPASANVSSSGSQQFTATARDQFGNALLAQPAFTWSLGAGSIGAVSATGLYTAPATATGTASVVAKTGVLSASATVSVVAQGDVTSGLIGRYQFEEGTGTAAVDSGSNPIAGTLTNGPVRTAGQVGAGAITLDGVNDYVATASNLATRLGGTATLTAWIKTTQVGSAVTWQAPGLTGVEETGGGNDIFWGWIDNTGRIGLQAADTPGAKSTNPVNDGQWHHVAFSRDSVTGVVKVYVDGVLNSTATSAAGLKTTPFASLGRIEDTAGTIDYFAGTMDDVRIYNRVLADSEVSTIKSIGQPVNPPATTYVSDLPYQAISNGWGPVEKDQSNGEQAAGDGKQISLGGTKYTKGLGTHANSEVVVNLNGQYTSFMADLGIDDEARAFGGSVVFQVYLDDLKVYDSGLITAASATRSINIDVTGHNKMQLVATDGGDGVTADHADWANARLLGVAQPAALMSGSATTLKVATTAPTAPTTTTTVKKTTTNSSAKSATTAVIGTTTSKNAKAPVAKKKK